MPATFSVDAEIYYAGTDGVPARLDIPALADGAVCFVGRDEKKAPILRLVMTEMACDGVVDALAALPDEQVAEPARKALAHVKSSPDVRRMLTKGLSLKGAKSDAWAHIPSETGANDGVSKMGLLAWNFAFPAAALAKGDLNKAGIIVLIKDRQQGDATGLEEAIRSGLVAAAQQAEESVTAEEANGAPASTQRE